VSCGSSPLLSPLLSARNVRPSTSSPSALCRHASAVCGDASGGRGAATVDAGRLRVLRRLRLNGVRPELPHHRHPRLHLLLPLRTARIPVPRQSSSLYALRRGLRPLGSCSCCSNDHSRRESL
ncbi:hypothetical protein PENTCL1PPCAC_9175, partial [Pristionchus entomophagus]